MGWTTNSFPDNDGQQLWEGGAADAPGDQFSPDEPDDVSADPDPDAPIQAVVAQDFSTRRLPAISDTREAPVIVRGSGMAMGTPFIKRRERPLTLRIAVLTLMICILVTGIFAFTPLVVGLWRRQARRGREPSTVAKMAIGCAGVAVANLLLAAAAWAAAGGKASWLWLLAYFVILTLGELYLSPTGLSLVSKLAPARLLSMMMGLWLATSFTGNFLAGWLGGLWSGMEKPHFFLMIAALAGLAGAAIGACSRPLTRRLRT